ncbi:MAG: hypothetical protein Q9227_001848 [Pyrenula ochraceoflavens]
MSSLLPSPSVQGPLIPKSSNVLLPRPRTPHSDLNRNSGSWKGHVPGFLRPKDKPDPKYPRRPGLLMDESGQEIKSPPTPEKQQKENESTEENTHVGSQATRPAEKHVRFTESMPVRPKMPQRKSSSKEKTDKVSREKLDKLNKAKLEKSFKPRQEKAIQEKQSRPSQENQPSPTKSQVSTSSGTRFDLLPVDEGPLRERLVYHVCELDSLYHMTKRFNAIKETTDHKVGELDSMKNNALMYGRSYEMRESLNQSIALADHIAESRNRLGRFIAYHRHEVERCVEAMLDLKAKNKEDPTLPAVLQNLPNDYEWKALFLY